MRGTPLEVQPVEDVLTQPDEEQPVEDATAPKTPPPKRARPAAPKAPSTSKTGPRLHANSRPRYQSTLTVDVQEDSLVCFGFTSYYI